MNRLSECARGGLDANSIQLVTLSQSGLLGLSSKQDVPAEGLEPPRP